MEKEKFKLHIDSVEYKDKEIANKDANIIKYRLQRDSPPIEVTITELAEAIQSGKTVSPAVMKGTKADDFVEQQVFMVDIDNKKTDIPILTVEDALSICEKYHLPLAFYYFSFSHKEKMPKYRLVFVMDKVITEHILRDTITRKLIDLFEQADTSCTNADRLFFGTNKKAVICDLEARINVDTVFKISPKSAIVKKAKSSREDKETAKSTREDKEIEKLINDFDFFSYLKERNGNIVRDSSRYIMFENCEICGHHNDLVYYPETNSFNCFSDDGDVGGTIIDYLMAVDKLTVTEAINKFKYELCGLPKITKSKLELICMDDIEAQKVKWLWYPYIPAGKVTILEGDPR